MVFGGLFSLYLCYQILKGVSLFKILCLDTEKIFSPKTSQNQKCLRLRAFWEFLCCRNTVVFQDKKCTKVRERRHSLAYAVRVLSPQGAFTKENRTVCWIGSICFVLHGWQCVSDTPAALVCNYENELNLNSLFFINRKGVHHSGGCRNRNTAEHQRV